MKIKKTNNSVILTVLFALVFIAGTSCFILAGLEKINTFKRISNLPGIDRGVAVIETRSSDVVAIGIIKEKSEAPGDILLVCADKTGKIKWTRTYGGKQDDMGWDLLEMPDKGFLLAGTTLTDNRNSRDMIAIRVDETGNVIWEKTFGTEKDEYCWDMVATEDGYYLLAGETNLEGEYGKGNKDFYVVKIDSKGNIIWTHTYGGQNTDRCYSADAAEDGYLLLGSTNSYGAGDQDAYLLKVDLQGKIQWSKTYGSEKFDMGHDVKCSRDGGCVVIGYSQTESKGENDAWIFKTDSEGKVSWDTKIGGEKDDRAIRGIQDRDGNYLITGYTKSFGASIWDLFLAKIDSEGKVIWRQNQSGSGAELGYGICLSRDGGILLTGQTYSYGNHKGDLWLLKTNSNGIIHEH
jgi:hypothetical protein